MSRLALFCSLFALVACTAPASPGPTFDEADLVRQGDTAILRTGTVSFFRPADGVLGVRLDESPVDGQVDRVYFLQGTDPADDAPPTGEIVEARVVDHRRALIVADGDGPLQILTLDELDTTVTLAVQEATKDGAVTRQRQILQELAGDDGMVQRIGFGLIEQIGGREIEWDDPVGTCRAGGPGAISAALGCQGAGCRVTCQDGYYPCLQCTDSGDLQCRCTESDR